MTILRKYAIIVTDLLQINFNFFEKGDSENMRKMRFVAAAVIVWCMVVLLSGTAQAAGRTVTEGTKQECVKNTKAVKNTKDRKKNSKQTEKTAAGQKNRMQTGKSAAGQKNRMRTGKSAAGQKDQKSTGKVSAGNTEKTQSGTKEKCRDGQSGRMNTLAKKLGALVKRDVSYSALSNYKVGKTISGKLKRYTQEELRYMTCIIYCEARGECYAGKKAVGIVVMNRVKDEQFPDTVEDVIYQSGQFTPARSGSLSRALAIYDRQEQNGRVKGTMKKCMKAAKSALTGSTTVQVRGRQKQMKSYLFFSRYIPDAAYSIGAHQFK